MNSITGDSINEAHRLARQHAESAVQYAIRCGELLIEKKSELPHGEFGAWVQANCEFSYSSARAYMQAAAKQTDSALAFSSLREALEHGKPQPELQGTPRYDRMLEALHEYVEWAATAIPAATVDDLQWLAVIAQDTEIERDLCAIRARAERGFAETLKAIARERAA